ncbi:uncharacterized protein N7515_009776 [Penicillium bovifimosum]|uniref:Uncharacterized protein n=1 Tax=Penicillium bovifimosum TaxID=126998 RepID=A0A9W9GHA8_9EURO|nr:uncharacterized protein N7515_009776 [Penicillium bovifimosum]KAJ5120388.1 hypothetical protein N7515_009776 [Penicillium bovifimosum]
MAAKIAAMNMKITEADLKIGVMESFRDSYLDVRQRTVATWIRDALNKGTGRRVKDIRRLNKEVLHGGDIRCDSVLVTERYRKDSTERKQFSTLYGLAAEEVNALGIIINPLNAHSSLIYSRPSKMRRLVPGIE